MRSRNESNGTAKTRRGIFLPTLLLAAASLLLPSSSARALQQGPGCVAVRATLTAIPAPPTQPTGFLVELQTFPTSKVRADYRVKIKVPKAISDAFVDVERVEEWDESYDIDCTVKNNSIEIDVKGIQNPDYEGLQSAAVVAQVNLSGLPAGTYPLEVQNLKVMFEPGSSPKVEKFIDDTDLEIGQPRIATITIPDGVAGRNYAVDIRSIQLEDPITVAITNGDLPAGLTVYDTTIFGTLDPGTAGTHAFTLQLTDKNSVVVSQAYVLGVVNQAPELQRVTFVQDADGSQSVTQGDVLELRFNEPIVVGANAASALQASAPGDSLGSGFTVQSSPDNRDVIVTLGTNPTLSFVAPWSENNSPVQVLPVAGGIEDPEGVAGVGTQPVIEPGPPGSLPNLVIGQAITPARITFFPALSSTVQVELPPGLTFTGGFIQGTPQAYALPTAEWDGVLDKLIVRQIEDDNEIEIGISYVTAPSFGPRQGEIVGPVEPGELLTLDIFGADANGPLPQVTLAGMPLIHAPTSDPELVKVVLPDTAMTGSVVVTQGAKVSPPEALQVNPAPNPGAPQINKGFVGNAVGATAGFIHVQGYSLSSIPQYFINGQPANILDCGLTFGLLELPGTLTSDDIIEVTVVVPTGTDSIILEPEPAGEQITDLGLRNGGGVFEFMCQEGANEDPPKDPPAKEEPKKPGEQKKCVCKAIDEAQKKIREAKGKKKNDEKEKRIKDFFLFVSYHESDSWKYRVQQSNSGTGPARGITQIEPKTLADNFNNGVLNQKTANNKNNFQAALDAFNTKPPGGKKWTAAQLEQAFTKLSKFTNSGKKGESNNWPKDDPIENALKNNDQFAFALSRIFFARYPAKDHSFRDYSGESGKQRAEDDWAKWWKEGGRLPTTPAKIQALNKARAVFKAKACKLLAICEALDD